MLPNFIQFLPLLSLWESPPHWYPFFSRLSHPSPIFSLISISCTCYWLLNMLSFLDFNPFWTVGMGTVKSLMAASLDFLCWWHLLMSAEFNRFATYVSENANDSGSAKTVAWAVSGDRKRKTTFIYSCAKKAPLDNLDDLAHVVCLERKSLNFLLNGNVVYWYFSTIFHVVLDLVLLRASRRSNEKREKK